MQQAATTTTLFIYLIKWVCVACFFICADIYINFSGWKTIFEEWIKFIFIFVCLVFCFLFFCVSFVLCRYFFFFCLFVDFLFFYLFPFCLNLMQRWKRKKKKKIIRDSFWFKSPSLIIFLNLFASNWNCIGFTYKFLFRHFFLLWIQF